MRIGSLFSGIGGLELGLERARLGRVVWQCEISPFCRSVLAKQWPTVVRYEDVTVPREWPHVDLICGGFPCQDVSAAGKGAGLQGSRSGLWYSFRSVLAKVAPRFVVVENVASGARRWLPHVRRDLHVLGYRTRAFALSAEDVGAHHLRRRVFIVAHPQRMQLRHEQGWCGGESGQGPSIAGDHGANGALADTARNRRPAEGERTPTRLADGSRELRCDGQTYWDSEPGVGRVVDGIPPRLDGRRRRARLTALGNAVVPQCAQVVGEMIREMLGK